MFAGCGLLWKGRPSQVLYPTGPPFPPGEKQMYFIGNKMILVLKHMIKAKRGSVT